MSSVLEERIGRHHCPDSQGLGASVQSVPRRDRTSHSEWREPSGHARVMMRIGMQFCFYAETARTNVTLWRGLMLMG